MLSEIFHENVEISAIVEVLEFFPILVELQGGIPVDVVVMTKV